MQKSKNQPKKNTKKISQKPLQQQKKSSKAPNLKQFDVKPQRPSKKSATGAFYNDGFDVVSKPERRNIRVEEFDELCGTVTGTAAFGITLFACNPGNSTTFPRLSKFAQLYEKYRWKRLEFYYQHDVSQFADQGKQGLVILSGLYDAASATPTLKTQVEVTEPHVICMPNQNSLLRFSPERLHPRGEPLYVRPGNLPGGADIKTYDAANAFVSWQGMAGTGEVGELHVRGSVELIGDILDASTVAAPANNQFLVLQSTAGEAMPTSTVAYTVLFSGTQVGSLGATNTNGTILLPAGNYLVDWDSTTAYTGNSTVTSMTVKKGGSAISNVGAQDSYPSGAYPDYSLHQSTWLVSDGTAASALTFVQTNTWSTGASTVYGAVRILAV